MVSLKQRIENAKARLGEGLRKGAGGQIIEDISGKDVSRPIKNIPEQEGLSSSKSRVSSGSGLGGGSSNNQSKASPSDLQARQASAQVEATRQQALEAQRIRDVARQRQVSAEVQARREKAIVSKRIREEAKISGVSPQVQARRPIIQRQSTKKKDIKTINSKPISTVTRVQEPTGVIEKGLFKLERIRSRSATKRLRGEQSFKSEFKAGLAGAGTSVLGTGLFLKQITTQPKSTVKSLASSIKDAPQLFAKANVVLEQEPSFAVGFIGGELLQLKASNVVLSKKPSVPKITGSSIKVIKPSGTKTPLIKTFAREPIVFFGEKTQIGKPIKIIKSDKISIKRFNQQQRIKKAVSTRLREPKITPTIKLKTKQSSIRKQSIKTFQKNQPKFTFDIDTTKFSQQRARFKSGADIVRFNKGKAKIVQAPKSLPKSKPVTFSIDKSAFNNQRARFKSGADIIQAKTKKGTTQLLVKPTTKQKVKTEIKTFVIAPPEFQRVVTPNILKSKQKKVIKLKTSEFKPQVQAQKQLEKSNLKTVTIQIPKQKQQSQLRFGLVPKTKQKQSKQQLSLQTQSSLSSQLTGQGFNQRPLQLLSSQEGTSSIQKKPQRFKSEASLKLSTPQKTPQSSKQRGRVRIKPPPLFRNFNNITKQKTIRTSSQPTKIFKPKSLFGVSVRRRGKFKPIGSGLSLGKAFSLGRERTSRTLAATFKITPQRQGSFTGSVGAPFGFRTGKTPLTFVEKRGQRLSTGSEVSEINLFKRRRKRKR